MSLRKATKLFEEFHSFEPRDVGNFRKGFRVPKRANYVGEAKTMYYSSDKFNPATGEDEGVVSYYHPHEGGVRLYLCDDEGSYLEGEERNIPKWIHEVSTLVRLGDCEGFEYVDFSGQTQEAKAEKPLPEWYCIPSGKALLLVQSKRKVLAILWGGDLRVEWRGVVG